MILDDLSYVSQPTPIHCSFPYTAKPAGAIAGSEFLRKPIKHRTRSRNCRPFYTYSTPPVVLAYYRL